MSRRGDASPQSALHSPVSCFFPSWKAGLALPKPKGHSLQPPCGPCGVAQPDLALGAYGHPRPCFRSPDLLRPGGRAPARMGLTWQSHGGLQAEGECRRDAEEQRAY